MDDMEGRTVLIMKDKAKGNVPENYRPFTFPALMWKTLKGITANHLYDHLEDNELLPEEQKGCRRRSRGTKDQLLIDKMVLKDCKSRKSYLAMAWIDYKKAYDMIQHSWILECLELIGISECTASSSNKRGYVEDNIIFRE